jgi:hypothetical protein
MSEDCAGTTVHMEPHQLFPELAVPWLATAPDGSIVGFVFYPLADGEAVLRPGPTLPDGSAQKILWAIPAGGDATLDVKGSRRGDDAGGFFEQRFPAHPGEHGPEGTRWYPATMRVPEPGCWELLLRSGRAIGTITFRVEREEV